MIVQGSLGMTQGMLLQRARVDNWAARQQWTSQDSRRMDHELGLSTGLHVQGLSTALHVRGLSTALHVLD